MIEIIKPGIEIAHSLAELAKKSFIESHGSSASEEDIQEYVNASLTETTFLKELNNANNIFKVALYNGKLAGYLKIILNCKNPKLQEENVCKLERLYVLKEFYDKKIGIQLLKECVKICMENNQKGIWLYVWTENHRALNFYKKAGFEIIAETSFKISSKHSNPNYWLYLPKEKFTI